MTLQLFASQYIDKNLKVSLQNATAFALQHSESRTAVRMAVATRPSKRSIKLCIYAFQKQLQGRWKELCFCSIGFSEGRAADGSSEGGLLSFQMLAQSMQCCSLPLLRYRKWLGLGTILYCVPIQDTCAMMLLQGPMISSFPAH